MGGDAGQHERSVCCERDVTLYSCDVRADTSRVVGGRCPYPENVMSYARAHSDLAARVEVCVCAWCVRAPSPGVRAQSAVLRLVRDASETSYSFPRYVLLSTRATL